MTNTIKDKAKDLAELRAEIKTLEEEAKKLQQELMDMQEREGELVYDDLGIRVFEKRNATYKIKDPVELQKTHPENIKVRYVIAGLTETEKSLYFDRKLSKPYVAIEFIS